MPTIEWKNGVVVTVDQTKLPNRIDFLEFKSCEEIAKSIRKMQIRGAPLLGAAAAYGLALTAHNSKARDKQHIIQELEASARILRRTRPTAVNLFWAINRMLDKAKKATGNASLVSEVVVAEAQRIAQEDADVNLRIGKHGSSLIDKGDTVLTHCNAGSLATVDYGTALSIIRAAWNEHKGVNVIATETRPLLQGARLTSYELHRDGIPVTLITDSMVGYAMSEGLVQKVVVGADRIVRDAVINKIGTYSVALLAQAHEIPFYVAAPKSTFDLKRTSKDIIIEERNVEEVVNFRGIRIAPEGVSALNPAFDVTPLRYITQIVCEEGIISPVDLQRLAIED